MSRRVELDVDDVERLLELATTPPDATILPAGWTGFGPDGEGPLHGNGRELVIDYSDEVLIDRVKREAGLR